MREALEPGDRGLIREAGHLVDDDTLARRVVERADSFRALLQNALTVQATLVGQQQNEEMQAMTAMSIAQNEEVKKISAWAAIFFAPTFVASVYGMNFRDMPELKWRFGYPFALALMVLLAYGLYRAFKRRGWL